MSWLKDYFEKRGEEWESSHSSMFVFYNPKTGLYITPKQMLELFNNPIKVDYNGHEIELKINKIDGIRY